MPSAGMFLPSFYAFMVFPEEPMVVSLSWRCLIRELLWLDDLSDEFFMAADLTSTKAQLSVGLSSCQQGQSL